MFAQFLRIRFVEIGFVRIALTTIVDVTDVVDIPNTRRIVVTSAVVREVPAVVDAKNELDFAVRSTVSSRTTTVVLFVLLSAAGIVFVFERHRRRRPGRFASSSYSVIVQNMARAAVHAVQIA